MGSYNITHAILPRLSHEGYRHWLYENPRIASSSDVIVMLKWRQKIHPSGSPFVIIRKLRDAKPWSSVLIFLSHARTWVRFVDSDIASAAGSLIVWSESSFIVIASKALVWLRMCVVSPEPSWLDDTMRIERLYRNTAIPCSRADNWRPQGGGGLCSLDPWK